MAIDLNTNPYYDDYDGTKNYHQILFKPGQAVQSRELTQIQSILKDQIKRFGDHVFQHGSVVIPGNSYADLGAAYVKVARTYNGVVVDFVEFEGKTIISSTTGVKASVRKVADFGDTGFAVLYLSYISGGTEGQSSFTRNEVLQEVGGTQVFMQTLDDETAVGKGSLAFVSAGVYYVNGVFGYVPSQSVVISAYDSLPTCSVILRITERVVTPSNDETLLDPAQGSYNYAAPGADRLQMLLTLERTDVGVATDADVIELMRYVDGELLEHARNPKYSELDKSLARRTYDESGDYVVNGLVPTIQEHRRVGNNGGAYADGDANAMLLEVSPGKAYIQGFEVEKLGRTRIKVAKGREADHIKHTYSTFRPQFGNFLLVSDLNGVFSIASQQEITLWNTYDATDSLAVQVGSARIVGFDYHAGDPATSPIYKIYVSNFITKSGYTADDIGGFRFLGGNGVVLAEYSTTTPATALVLDESLSSTSGAAGKIKYVNTQTGTIYLYKHSRTNTLPRVRDTLTGGVSTAQVSILYKNLVGVTGQPLPIFPAAKAPAFSLKNPNGTWNLEYTAQKELEIITNNNGDGSVTISVGSINPVEVGSFYAFYSGGRVSNDLFSINETGNTLTITGGPVTQTIRVFCHVSKENVAPKTKTLTTETATLTLASAGALQLSKFDIHRLVSVLRDGNDITATVRLDNGQRDYCYEYGSVSGVTGILPAGTYTVTYQYFRHSITGDFFCVDSYAGNAGYLDMIATHRFNNIDIDLLNSIDFRPAVGAGNSLAAGDALRNDMIVTGTPFESDLQFYVPRIDAIVASKGGGVSVVRGTPAERPNAPATSNNQMVLDYLFVPAYTKTLASAALRRVAVEGYTMADIEGIKERIENLEEFVTITAAETETSKYEILDAETGMNRFKTGYLVESFADPLIMARTSYEGYSASFVGDELHPASEVLNCNLRPIEYTNVVDCSGYFMLPYEEVAFAQQPLSSRITNVNPFMVTSWNGTLRVQPPSDNWVEVTELPTIFERKEEFIDVVIQPPPPPAPPPPPPPPAPPPPPPRDSPLTITPATSKHANTSMSSYSGVFKVTNIHSAAVTVNVQEISRPTNGSTTIQANSRSKFVLQPGESRDVGFSVTLPPPYSNGKNYEYGFAALAEGFGGRYPTHTATVVKSEVPATVTEYTTSVAYGGWYGIVLGRAGEGAGTKFWADAIKQHGAEKAATWFVQQAKENYQKGAEKTFNYLDPAQLIQQAKGMISETITTRNEVIKSTGGTVISTRPVQHIVNATNYEGIAILS